MRVTKSLFDQDPQILSSGARLQRKLSTTFDDFVNNFKNLFIKEEENKIVKDPFILNMKTTKTNQDFMANKTAKKVTKVFSFMK